MDVIKYEPREDTGRGEQGRQDHVTLSKALFLLSSREGAHKLDDGRGLRRVYCNGVEVKECTSCHEGEGWAIHADSPPVVNRFCDIDEHIKMGKITVEFIEDARNK